MKKYLIVIEQGETSYGAYAPDLPGCAAVGDTPEEALELMREAVVMHLEGMIEDGDPIPEPTCSGEYIEVDIPELMKGKSA